MHTKKIVWLGALILLIPLAFRVAGAEPAKKTGTPVVVPVFTFDRALTEKPPGDELLLGALGAESFQQLVARLEKARDDQQVKAIVFFADSVQLGNGQIEEVRHVLDAMKQAGKELYVHGDALSMGSYALFSGASRISVVPTGDLWLTGLYGESMHLRRLLEMIGVEPDFLTCGAYKSAAEMFTRAEPSPEADENLNWLLDGMFDSYVNLIASGRHTSAEQVRGWIDKGLYSAAEAHKLGIIDAVEFRPELSEHLKAKYGDNIKFDHRYGKEQGLTIDLSNPFGLFKFYADLLSGPQTRKSNKDAVAIVHVEGPILSGKPDPDSFPFGSAGMSYSEPISKALDEAAADDKIKAVVLRVNSPGGSAVGSEVILQATRRVKAKKPLVVSMGDVAGSGGYYVACAADTIFADPSTITASIGVVGGKLATEAMWSRIGINTKQYRRGQNAGILSSGVPFSDQERQTLQAWMDEIYGVFKGHVLAIRKDRLKKDLEEIAGGRVYTGRQALELGLIDKLGGLRDAIDQVAQDAGLEEGKYDIRVLPRPKSPIESLMEGLGGAEEAEDSKLLSLGAAPSGTRGLLLDAAWKYLTNSSSPRAKAARVAVTLLDVLNHEQVSLHMPMISIGDR
jgi:protease-4